MNYNWGKCFFQSFQKHMPHLAMPSWRWQSVKIRYNSTFQFLLAGLNSLGSRQYYTVVTSKAGLLFFDTTNNYINVLLLEEQRSHAQLTVFVKHFVSCITRHVRHKKIIRIDRDCLLCLLCEFFVRFDWTRQTKTTASETCQNLDKKAVVQKVHLT